MNNEFDEILGGDVQELNKTEKKLGSASRANCEGAVEVTYKAPKLHNFDAPFHVNKKETPTQRAILEVAAKGGYTNREIAKMFGRTPVNVNNIIRQPHSQEFLANEIRRINGEDETVVQVIKENVVAAVTTLAGIMNDVKARNADRIAAAEKLLERRYGKANQPINRASGVNLDELSDEDLLKMLPGTSSTGTAT